MKEKKDCKECGAPLEDWQVKQGYDLCLECYKSKKTGRKTSHELLQDKSTEEEGEIEEKNEHKRKETRDEKEEEEEVEGELGENGSEKDQGEEKEIEEDEEE
jgi:cobalamin biosynthesis protein CobT